MVLKRFPLPRIIDRPPREVTVAATQMSLTWDLEGNMKKAEDLVRKAASQGAQIILIQELFLAPYFCDVQEQKHFKLAMPFSTNPSVNYLIPRFQRLAKELNVVLPISFFERGNYAYYNSLCVIDGDGTVLPDIYRKSHIPDGPGYQEKFYFNPGDSGFKVWDTKYAKIGVAICWDQWFPETARCLALMGAEILFYPTAIGSEPQDASIDSQPHWTRVMQGHAGANVMPVVASNRTGKEDLLTFYGSAFITDPTGHILQQANRTDDNVVLVQKFDLEKIRLQRASWGLFRDRRPELYYPITTLDGQRLSAAAMGKHCTDVSRNAPPQIPGASRPVKVAATQMTISWDLEANMARAETLVREAAAQGAQIILLQELFLAPYFCDVQEQHHFKLAMPFSTDPDENFLIPRFQRLARELNVVLPISFFERANYAYYNSLCVIDADGSVFPNIYRKSHIPDGPGYQEKFYFNPGDTGFQVWDTKYAKIGVGICWDQWFPETARCLALMGAEILFYPTAIGSEPQDASIDSQPHWTRVMQGHAGANVMPVVATNRTGTEDLLTFYGSAFIADPTGAIVKQANKTDDMVVLVHEFDLEQIRMQRASWGLFRDRRPELYHPISTLDGVLTHRAAVARDTSAAPAKLLPPLDTPKTRGFTMPGQFEKMQGVWLLWPRNPNTWREDAKPARAAFANFIKLISKETSLKVYLATHPDDVEGAKAAVGEAAEIVPMVNGDSWMRDSGPTFVKNRQTGEVAGVDWEYNGYGGDLYPEWQLDTSNAREAMDHMQIKTQFSTPGFVLEGGSIDGDGEGTVLTTEECLMNIGRNPHMSKDQIEQMLKDHLSADKVIWLNRGVVNDFDTNGHVDNLVAYTAPGEVILPWTDDPSDPMYAVCRDSEEKLTAEPDAKGRTIKVHKVPSPVVLVRPEEENHNVDVESRIFVAGYRLPATYANLFIANEAVFVPTFDVPEDEQALEVLKGVFTGRKIIPVLSRDILLGGGNLHCITQNVPA